MKMLAYGEDALTLWAVNKRLSLILQKLNDSSSLSDCRVIFRPSFGRRGGELSPQFGEFDFIILSKSCLYLGESKWDRSSESIQDGKLILRDEQFLRHHLFQFYVKEWGFGQYANWHDFIQKANEQFLGLGIPKTIAPVSSLLAKNLQTILGLIREHYHSNIPEVRNVLLYFHTSVDRHHIPKMAGNCFETFEVIDINYADIGVDNFVEFDLEME